MHAHEDLRTLIDSAVRAEKTVAGYGMWYPDNRKHCHSWMQAIEIGGEIQDLRLYVKHYANNPSPKFRILLSLERCVWRLDFGEGEEHPNPLTAMEKAGELLVGSHYHSWADNRQYAGPNSLPRELHAARILPPDITGFEKSFVWFCEKTRIRITDADIPKLPGKDLLL